MGRARCGPCHRQRYLILGQVIDTGLEVIKLRLNLLLLLLKSIAIDMARWLFGWKEKFKIDEVFKVI